MIEYIRRGQIIEALSFAQQELAPRGEENPTFLAELERTMALLAFDTSFRAGSATESTHAVPPHIQELLHPSQRSRTARQLNSAILISQSHGKDPKLPNLLRMMVWGESLLEQRADFPKLELAKLLAQTQSGQEPFTRTSGQGSAGTDGMVI